MRILFVLIITMLNGCVTDSAETQLRQEHIALESTRDFAAEAGYSEAVRVGNTLWISGQVGFDAEGVTAQSRLAFENLERVLVEAGASLADIVELTSYHLSEEGFTAFMEVKAEYIKAPYPAWTAIEVESLLEPSLLIEVKAVAVIGSGAARESAANK